MRFSLLFILKVDCAKYHKRLARKKFVYNRPDAQKHAVIKFSFQPLIIFIVNKIKIHAVEILIGP